MQEVAEMRKKILYWLGYALLMGAGCAAALTRVVPTQNTATFLVALTFLWDGSLTLLNCSPVFRTDMPRRYRTIYIWAVLALGLMWLAVSVHPRADEGWLQAVTGIPMLAVIAAAWHYYKKKGSV